MIEDFRWPLYEQMKIRNRAPLNFLHGEFYSSH
jgi:hypothetical protein